VRGLTLAVSVGGRTSSSTQPSFTSLPASLADTFCTLPSRICGGRVAAHADESLGQQASNRPSLLFATFVCQEFGGKRGLDPGSSEHSPGQDHRKMRAAPAHLALPPPLRRALLGSVGGRKHTHRAAALHRPPRCCLRLLYRGAVPCKIKINR
jgi:hypothetical protein